jgi:2-iminobutanoate/2-iminopropanoate deaminase
MNNKEALTSERAPKAIGPYSPGILSNGFAFLSGQIPLKPDNTLETGSIRAQTARCLDNIRELLRLMGADLGDIVKSTVFVTDLADFTAVNEVYAEYFAGTLPPARSFVQVVALPKGAAIEIEVIARKPA